MKSFLVVLLLGIFQACHVNSDSKVLSGSVTISAKDLGVTKVENIKWSVGPKRKQKVSKGIRIESTIPYIDEDAMATIVDRYKVNAWLVRLRRKGLMRNKTVGMISMPLIVGAFPRGSSERVRQSKGVSFRVFYRSAAVSTRFAGFHCPAFEHKFLVENTSIESFGSKEKSLRVSGVTNKSLQSKISDFSYNLTLDGGLSMEGQYFIDLAFYNSTSKKRKSNWLTLTNTGKVKREKSVRIKGCENFVIPDIDPLHDQKIKQFKLGR